MCRLSAVKTTSSWTSWPLKWDRMVIPKCWNVINTLCCVQSLNTADLKTCSVSVCSSIRRMQNGGILMCSVTLLQKMSSSIKSLELPGQEIGPAVLIQNLCSRFKSFNSKNHNMRLSPFDSSQTKSTHKDQLTCCDC